MFIVYCGIVWALRVDLRSHSFDFIDCHRCSWFCQGFVYRFSWMRNDVPGCSLICRGFHGFVMVFHTCLIDVHGCSKMFQGLSWNLMYSSCMVMDVHSLFMDVHRLFNDFGKIVSSASGLRSQCAQAV